MTLFKPTTFVLAILGSVGINATATAANLAEQQAQYKARLTQPLDPSKAPSQNFDLSKMKINLPVPDHKPARKGKVMEIEIEQLNDPIHPYTNHFWFYTNPQDGAMVMASPNTAPTTKNSSNARSELRVMLRKGTAEMHPRHAANNFVIAAHSTPEKFGAIGGELSATLAVDWVSTSGDDSKFPAHSVVVGQIHGPSKTEPLKIYYRKMPNHEYGSLFWNYEIYPQDIDQRKDIPIAIWGDPSLTKDSADPVNGIKLGELFSYDVTIKNNIMTLTFVKHPGTSAAQTKIFKTDLSKPYPGEPLDQGYKDAWMYFKAGAYNQCNQGTKHPTWGTGCSNNGIEAGDYTQVSFYQLNLNQ
ncbi:polysaccharide lyase family 7 protein [Shewanella intestini]|uniref:Polysaccharide lyase family 7 protein n=1 Tax=Shewanella intestini TaxID=2017544 RepID=A0ABS5I504_9GAMM|nr:MULTISPECIES: polysaccharide lyase family 7 protein [Shewanella]MBR9728913.1 polysaccharide lyase family 7 protein [Shewanella intestini]MRG37021.1 polysaccharide lyase family 7 protein [Shewanella sp. XMDDZSB0408]